MAKEKSATQQYYESNNPATPWESLSKSEKAKVTLAMRSGSATAKTGEAAAPGKHVDGSIAKRPYRDGSAGR